MCKACLSLLVGRFIRLDRKHARPTGLQHANLDLYHIILQWLIFQPLPCCFYCFLSTYFHYLHMIQARIITIHLSQSGTSCVWSVRYCYSAVLTQSFACCQSGWQAAHCVTKSLCDMCKPIPPPTQVSPRGSSWLFAESTNRNTVEPSFSTGRLS